jgi:hypothetical protein
MGVRRKSTEAEAQQASTDGTGWTGARQDSKAPQESTDKSQRAPRRDSTFQAPKKKRSGRQRCNVQLASSTYGCGQKKIKEKKEESHRLHTTKTQGLQTET